MTKIHVAIQASADDFTENDFSRHSAADIARALVGSGQVTLVVPETGSDDQRLREFANINNIPILVGDDFDVNSRFAALADQHNVDLMIRLTIANFFADAGIIWAQVEHLVKEGLDLCRLPKGFDSRFGADVSTGSFFRKVAATFGPSVRPWAEATSTMGVRVGTLPREVLPRYGPVRSTFLSEQLAEFGPERVDTSTGPQEFYDFFRTRIRALLPQHPRPRVLDLASGNGSGAAFLAHAGMDVLGVDYDPVAVKLARERFEHPSGPSFIVGDAADFRAPKLFDAVVSVCTMGHIEEDLEFLRTAKNNLHPEGLFLNAPALRVENPCGRILSRHHHHEYSVQELVARTEKFFEILEVWGFNRGVFGPVDTADRFAVVVARNRRA